MATVAYLDTHVVLWLAGARELLSERAASTIRTARRLLVSPMVDLEIEYLYEVGRITRRAAEVLGHLRSGFNLAVCDRPFATVVEKAKELQWTREPFDRLITAQAALGGDPLLTRDKTIAANYPHAVW